MGAAYALHERDHYELQVLRMVVGMPRDTITDLVSRCQAYLVAMWIFDHPPL